MGALRTSTRKRGLTTREIVSQVDADLLKKQLQIEAAQVIGLTNKAVPDHSKDVQQYREFVDPRLTSAERDNHPVTQKIFEAVDIVVQKHRCLELRDELLSEVTVGLLSYSRFAGQSSLMWYLLTILDHKVPDLRREPVRGKHKYRDADAPGGFATCRHRYVWLDDEERNPGFELTDPRTENLERESMFLLCLEPEMKKLMKRSDIHRVAGEMITNLVNGEYDAKEYPTGRLTRRQIARVASGHLKRKITPHKAQKVLDDFKPVLAQLLNRDEREGPDHHV